jgi:hypothetical protein
MWSRAAIIAIAFPLRYKPEDLGAEFDRCGREPPPSIGFGMVGRTWLKVAPDDHLLTGPDGHAFAVQQDADYVARVSNRVKVRVIA